MSISCIDFRKQFGESDLLHGGDTENLQDFPKRVGQVQPTFRDGHQEACANLHPHAVEGSAVESAQAQVLLDPAEEQLDRPSPAIDLGDDQGIQVELIGDKDQRLAGLRIHKADTPKLLGITRPARRGVEDDRLVASQAAGLIDEAAFRHIETGVRFEPRDKEGPSLVQLILRVASHCFLSLCKS